MSKTLGIVVLLFALSIVVGCGGESTDVAEAEKPVLLPADDDEGLAEPAVTEPSRTSAFEVDENIASDDDIGTTPSDLTVTETEFAEDGPQIEQFMRQINEAMQQNDIDTATQIAEQAYEANPDDDQLRQIAISLYMQTGQLDRVVGILEPIVEASPEDSNTSLTLAQVYMSLAESTDVEGEAALAYMRKAGKIVREQQTKGVFEQLGERGQMFLSNVFYNEAKLLAGHGEAEDAITALREAFDVGFSEISSLESDESFAALADSAAFQTMVTEYGEKIRARLREEARAEIEENEPFEFSFELPDLAGEPVSTSDFAGKILIVDFWATWCGPCQMEMPHFVRLRETYGEDLDIVGVSFEGVPEEKARPIVDDFVKQNEIPYRCVLGNEDVGGSVPDFTGLPTTIFLDREGNVRLKVVGYHSYEKLEAIVRELIDETKVPA